MLRAGAALTLLGAAASAFGAGPARAEAAASAWARNEQAAVRLVAATEATGSAEALRLGLQFALQPGWKTYWRSPGDAGFPPRVDLAGSENVGASELRWPAPERFELFGLDTFGYGGEVVLPLVVRPERPGAAVHVNARVEYLVCETICIPHEARLELRLPPGPARPSAFAHLIDRYNARVPAAAGGGIEVERALWRAGTAPELLVSARSLAPFAAPDVYVEGAPAGWSFGRPTVERSAGGTQALLRVPVRSDAKTPPAAPVGATLILTVVDGDRATEARVPVMPGGEAGAARTLAAVLGLALLGGFILNFMPCVLPVLSLKLAKVAAAGGAGARAVRASFLATAAGILASFLLLAGALLALRGAGHSVGWGIQFQQPAFLAFMAAVVTLFAANLWGWFEIRVPRVAAAAAERLPTEHPSHPDLPGAFATGALATLLATPCSAPFLGTAVGFALTGTALDVAAVFAALGVGLASPYLAVAAVPRIARVLPRPGAWMRTLRLVLGLALIATAAWLLSVLAVQIGARGALALALLLALTLAFLFALREGGAGRRVLRFAGMAATIGLAAALPARFDAAPGPAPVAAAENGWVPFDRAAIAPLVAGGRTVLVDVTADWCITCQVNKSLVLTRGEVAARLAGPDGGVVAMRADWTRPDPAIADYLASFGRYGIPFNAVYGPGAPGGIALPELLTADAVLAAFDRAAGAGPATARAQ